MKIEQIEQLIEIKNCGSISKAAMNLHMAQSTLSSSIKIFEDELGCQLIDRGNKGVSLTPFGMEVYNQGKTICELVHNLKRSISNTTSADMVLSVSNNYSVIGNDAFIALYNKHNGKHCKLKIQDCSVTEAIDNVSSGVSEVGLVRFPVENREVHLRTMKRKGVEYHCLNKKVLCVVVGEKNPLYRIETDTIKLEYLSQFPFAGYYDEETDIIFEKILPKNERVKENISIGSVEHLKEIIRKTDAFTLDVFKDMDLNSTWYEGLRYIPIIPHVYCEFGWIKKQEKPLSPIGEEYVEDIRDLFIEYHADSFVGF